MTIKELQKSTALYQRLAEITGDDYSAEIAQNEKDIETIRHDRKMAKYLREMNAQKTEVVWGSLIQSLTDLL